MTAAAGHRLFPPTPTPTHPPGAQVVDFSAVASAREVLFWRIFFEQLFDCARTSDDVAATFARIAMLPEHKALRVTLRAFLRQSVGPWLAAREPEGVAKGGGGERLTRLLRGCRAAEKALGG
jgi:hypothetical protein